MSELYVGHVHSEGWYSIQSVSFPPLCWQDQGCFKNGRNGLGERTTMMREHDCKSTSGKRSQKIILVVEDNSLVLKPVMGTLKNVDFTVLSPTSAEQALRIEAAVGEMIHLLLSSGILPDMSGPELGRKLKELHPAMRLMLMACYPDQDMFILQLSQTYDWDLTQKPFGGADGLGLIDRVKSILRSTMSDRGIVYCGASRN